jgi:peptidoglycan/xylan/chitin deacetylase (PgdA/CDA1 family)
VNAAARAGSALAAGVAAAHLLPSVLTVPHLHRRVARRLSGRSTGRHIALTFDDGPNPQSTPAFLDALAGLDVRATFFLLGTEVERHPATARRIVEDGHEVAVHGWSHVPHLLRTPRAVFADLDRACRAVRSVTGTEPRFWRPPNGVVTGAGLLAARRQGLQPVLWTADGQDWRAGASPDTVLDRLGRRLQAGATVLLHDSDITSAPGSWRAALAAVPELVRLCHNYGWTVGPLRDHWEVAG